MLTCVSLLIQERSLFWQTWWQVKSAQPDCPPVHVQVQPFNINLTSVGPKTCNRGEEWGTYKDVVNCNTCRIPGLRVTKESIWGFFEGEAPEQRLGLPLERTQEVRPPSLWNVKILDRVYRLYSYACIIACSLSLQVST